MGYAELNVDDINVIFSRPRCPSLIFLPTKVLYLLGSVRRDQSHTSSWLTGFLTHFTIIPDSQVECNLTIELSTYQNCCCSSRYM
jgi:hypothetical protein